MAERKQDARADLLSGLLRDRAEVERRTKFGCPAFFAGSRLFACVSARASSSAARVAGSLKATPSP